MPPTPKKITELKPSDLPTPPHSIIRIVQACSNADVGAQKLARIVASDPVFTAEILRTVNSAIFGLRQEVRSANQAVAVLGNRALRNMALCLAVRDALKDNKIEGFDTLEYWEDALRRAVGAQLVAQHVGFDAAEAFTIGLLQDFGMLAIMFARPNLAIHWDKLRAANPDRRYVLERQLLGASHDHVGLMLAKAWALPTSVSLPMACHHSLTAKALPDFLLPACKIASSADWLASVFTCEDKTHVVKHCRSTIAEHFKLSANTVDQIMSQLPSGVELAAESLGLRVKEQPKLENVMREANRQLIEENIGYQELTWQLERALAEKERLAIQLQDANNQLEKLAYVDPLTGLVNHRRFHEVFPAEVSRHGRTGRPISLLMIDLDHFKSINDTYGHPFGDTVLESVAGSIITICRSTDIKARIGGEEMCVLLPESDAENSRLVAERLRRAIEGLELYAPGCKVQVTASFGGCTWSGNVTDMATVKRLTQTMMDAADTGLYDSKHGGRNQVTWRTIEDPNAPDKDEGETQQ